VKSVAREAGLKKKAAPELLTKLKHGTPTQAEAYRFFRRNFTRRDAARLAWMMCVADPFGAKAMPVPATITTGASASCPRMYAVTLKQFTTVNSVGACFIGLSADAWLPDPTRPAGSAPQPLYLYLGNSSAFGSRGWPLHWTNSAYAGCAPTVTGSTGYSYPGPAIAQTSAIAGMNFMQLPDTFIDTQLNCNPTTGNAFQRFQCVSAGLRVRPTGPAAGALVQTGVIMITQQTLGDTVVTNPAAASGTGTLGGPNCYGHMSGLATGSTAGTVVTQVAPLPPDSIGAEEWDIASWPSSTNEKDWLEAAAIPNQSCSFGQWTPGNTGSTLVGYPQLSAIVAGSQQGQVIEFEARLVYAWYGAVSYEENSVPLLASVPPSDLTATVTDGKAHLSISNRAATPARAAVQAMAQPAVNDGTVHPSNAAAWINSGKEVIEAATGSSIGELIGEGLRFLAGALL